MINRKHIKSDYLDWDNGKPIRIKVIEDVIEKEKEKTGGGHYTVFKMKVKRVSSDEEPKFIELWQSDYRKMVKQADEKAGKELETLVGCIFDYKITIIEEEKGNNWKKEITLVSCPMEKINND